MTTLREFLSELATDATRLGEFILDADASMSAAELSEEDKAALRSGFGSVIAARLAGMPTEQAFGLPLQVTPLQITPLQLPLQLPPQFVPPLQLPLQLPPQFVPPLQLPLQLPPQFFAPLQLPQQFAPPVPQAAGFNQLQFPLQFPPLQFPPPTVLPLQFPPPTVLPLQFPPLQFPPPPTVLPLQFPPLQLPLQLPFQGGYPAGGYAPYGYRSW